jgi:recombination protein RecT
MTNAVAPAPKNPLVALREKIEARRAELKAALPSDIPVEAFIRAAMTQASINPDILTCSFPSIWNALLRSCRDGLLPDGVEAAIAPFKQVASYMPMYQGHLRNFRRSGKFKWVDADVVRQGEEFTYFKDQNGVHLKHVPGESSEAPIVRVYAVATTTDGASFVSVMTMTQIEKIRRMSKNTRDDAPWKVWPEEMMKKTPLRRLSKLLPTLRDIMKSDLDEHGAPDIGPLVEAPLDQIEQRAEAAVTETKSAAPADGGGQEDVGKTQAPPAAAAAEDPVAVAYARGQKDRAAGAQRRAVPPEYRDKDRLDEGRAWQDGWDKGQQGRATQSDPGAAPLL